MIILAYLKSDKTAEITITNAAIAPKINGNASKKSDIH